MTEQLTGPTYEQMVRVAIKTDANVKRHLRDFGIPGVLNVGSTSSFDSEARWLIESTSSKENPSFAIGTHSRNPKADDKYQAEKQRIMRRLEENLVMASVEWKANMLRMEQESATYSAELSDERSTIIAERDAAKDAIREYHRVQLYKMGVITSEKISFFTEGCPFNEGTIVVFANGYPISADYSDSLQWLVKNLRANLGEGYNVAYFASDALGTSEELWLKTKIKEMVTKTN